VFRWRLRNVEHIALRLLALAMAVGLWLMATGSPQQNLGLDRRTVRVEAAFERTPDALEVTSSPETVEVTVEGPRLVLPFQAQDVEVYLDLEGYGAGTHRVPVQARHPSGIGVVSVSPREVTVVLEPRVARSFEVSAGVVGAPAGWSVRIVEAVPGALEVYGAKSQVDKVAYVLAQAPHQRGGAGALTVRVPAVPVDESGRPVEGVATSAQSVLVTYVIEQVAPGGSVPVVGSEASIGR